MFVFSSFSLLAASMASLPMCQIVDFFMTRAVFQNRVSVGVLKCYMFKIIWDMYVPVFR